MMQPVGGKQQNQPQSTPMPEEGRIAELTYWDGFIRSAGGDWADEFARRLDPHTPLQPFLAELLPAHRPISEIRILDVGAGPLSYLGKTLRGAPLHITAVDPLAGDYDEILARYNVTPPLRTALGTSENLVVQFGENRFDLVHARNSIDHSQNPVQAIQAMIAVAKPGGYVFMQHLVSEPTAEQYKALQQWNFYQQDADLWLRGRDERFNITQLIASTATIETTLLNDVWMMNKICKRKRAA